MMKKQSEARRNTLFNFGFGTDVMKKLVVCTTCNSLEISNKVYCSKCNAKLPKENLYDYYKAQHSSCENCGTVLSNSMDYCPHCGALVKKLSVI